MAVSEALDLNLTPEQATDLSNQIQSAVLAAKYARQELDDKIAAWWQRYEAEKPLRTLPFEQASNIRVPLTKWSVNAVLVRMMRTVFGQVPYIRVMDENPTLPPSPQKLEVALDHLSTTDLNLRQQGWHYLLNSLVEGTGVAKLGQWTPTRTIREKRGVDLIQQTLTSAPRLRLDVIDLKDFWVANPAIFDVHQQPWVAHRVWLTWPEILKRRQEGIYTVADRDLPSLKNLGTTRRQASQTTNLEVTRAELDKAQVQEGSAGDTVREWQFVEIEGTLAPKDDDVYEECLVTIALDWSGPPVRAQKFPFWNGRRNYLIYRPIPRVNRFYGMSYAGNQQPQQDELDTVLNQSLDATTITILAAMTPILNRTMKREWDKHRWKLLEPIYVDAPETFRTLGQTIIHPIQHSQAQIRQIFDIAERAAGISETQLGKTAEGSKTAFEIATVQHEGNVTFSEMNEQIQETNAELGYQIIEHAYQLSLESPAFLERLVKVCGVNPFEGVTLQDIRERWDFRPVGNTQVANRELEARKWMAIKQEFAQSPFVMADLHRLWYLEHKVLETAGAAQEAELIIGTEQDVEQMIQQQQQQQQMQQALAMAQAGYHLGEAMGSTGDPTGNGQTQQRPQPQGNPLAAMSAG